MSMWPILQAAFGYLARAFASVAMTEHVLREVGSFHAYQRRERLSLVPSGSLRHCCMLGSIHHSDAWRKGALIDIVRSAGTEGFTYLWPF